MIKVGTVRALWRYPVKGMAGESLDEVTIGAAGLAGDRRWALRDSARAEIQSCKQRPELLRCTARARDPSSTGVEVTLPDGTVLRDDDPALNARLTALVGRASTLEPLRPPSEIDFFRRYQGDGRWLEDLTATFAREPGEPLPDFIDNVPTEVAEFVAAPGWFFLVTPLHLLTSASLAHLRALNPAADWDLRRFRPNIVIDTAPELSGLVEQGWLGRRLRLGIAVIDCAGTTPRCGAVTRAQADFGADTSILRTVVRDAAQNVGIYGNTVTTGTVRVGDEVALAL